MELKNLLKNLLMPIFIFLALTTTTTKTKATTTTTTTPTNVTDDDEIRLINKLLSTYNKEVRPVENHLEPVQLEFGIAISQLIDLDEKNQVLISNIWIRMHWNNHFLKWNKSEYGGEFRV